jgi:hypothetical protein
MEARVLRRHGPLALTIVLLCITSVDLVKNGSNIPSKGIVHVMLGGALIFGLLASFYVPQKWRRPCEVFGLCLAIGAAWLLFAARA